MKTFKDGLTKAITPSQRHNRVLKHFLKQMVDSAKPSHHSPQGSTLAYMMHGLEEAGVSYSLRARPGWGYLLQPDKELELFESGHVPGTAPPSEKAVLRKVLMSKAFQELIGAEEWDLTEQEEEILWGAIKRLTATPE